MTISILTPDRTVFTGNVSRIALPGADGSFQILDNHAPLVSSLTGGRVELLTGPGPYSYYDADREDSVEDTTPNRKLTFSIDGGFVEVLNNEVNLLVQGAHNLR